MAKRIVECQINDEYVLGSGVVVGAAGSHDDVVLRLAFNKMWIGLNIYATFRDSKGENPTPVILTPSMLAEGEDMVYDLPIPAVAKRYEGKMMLTLSGYSVTRDGSQEDTATNTTTAYFRVLHSDFAALDDGSIDANIYQQVQSGLNELGGMVSDLRERIDEHDEDIASQGGEITELDGRVSKNTTDIAALRIEQNNKISALESKHAEEIEALEESVAAELSALESAHSEDITALENKNSADIAALESRQNDKIDDLKIEQNSKIAALDDRVSENEAGIAQLNNKLGTLGKINFKIVSSLPAEGDGNTIYLLRASKPDAANAFDEYIYTNGAWELIGSARVDFDINEYAKTQYVNNKFVTLESKHNVEISELRGKQVADKNYLEALISRLESRHDGLITKHDSEILNIDGMVTQNAADISMLITQLGDIEAALDGILAIQEEMICFPFSVYCEDIGTTYDLKVPKGMTWAEWCESDYNTIGAYCIGGGVNWDYNGEIHAIYHTYSAGDDIYHNVKSDEVIEEGHQYVCKFFGGIRVPFSIYCEDIGTTYDLKAAKGMTWRRWCESDYNTIGAYLGGATNAVYWDYNGEDHMIYYVYDSFENNVHNVKSDEVIEEGHQYVCKYWNIGG